MRICIHMQDVSSYLGGVQSVVAVIAGRLAHDGHDVAILCPDSGVDPAQQRELHPSIRLVRTSHMNARTRFAIMRALSRGVLALAKRGPRPGLPRFLSPLLRWAFLRRRDAVEVRSFLRAEAFDVVIGAGAAQSLLIALIADELPARTVGWQHSTFDSYYRRRGHGLYGLETLIRENFPKLDAVLVLNSTDKHKFDQRLKISTAMFGNPVEAREASHSPEATTIVFVGRLTFAHKGLDLLIDAFERVHARHPDWTLDVYGDGPDKEALRQLIVDRRLDSAVQLRGVTQNVTAALASAAIFAFPSRYEGFGITLVEAMRAGLPSVAFATDGPRDIVADRETGFLVENLNTDEFAQRLIQLIEDPGLRRSMGERAVKAAERYDPAQLVPQFLRLIGGN